MDTKHTKGPWEIDKVRPGMDLVNIVQGNSSRTASNVIAFDVLEHNAHLIAAAPDLLEALKKLLSPVRMMVSSLDSEPGNQIAVSAWSSRIQEAQAAIAKAEGK